MRLFVQGCLILLALGFSSSAFAQWVYQGIYCNTAWRAEDVAQCKQDAQAQVNYYATNGVGSPAYADFNSDDYPGRYALYVWNDPSQEPPEKDCTTDTLICNERVPEPRVCESPNFIDPETNECTEPEEVCFTTIESMSDRCVFIGETTPDAPPGCIRDEETQAEICLSESEGCYVADGKEICPTPDMVCGVKNGTFSCVAPEQEGCGYFNGERVCFTPDGDKVEPDSPDHPDNGGNLDGDDTNDPTDPRTPEEGGNPDNQPIDTTGQGEGATEGTAKEQLKALRQLRDDITNQNKANTGNGAALEQGISSGIGSAGDAAAGVLDGHITDIDSPSPMEGEDLSTIGGAVTGIFGAPAQCQDIVFGVDELSYTITCADGEKIRDLLGFLLYVFTIIRLFNVATRPAAAGTP